MTQPAVPSTSAETHGGTPLRVAPEVASELKTWRQGDVVRIPALLIIDADGNPCQYATPDGVALLSQTCDIVQADRLTVVAAPLVRLSDDVRRQAAKGKRPRYVALPAVGDDAFVDLDFIGTLRKESVVSCWQKSGLGPDDMAVRTFGRRVARMFGRFAFPDEVVPWLAPLADIVAEKYHKASAGEAQALRHIAEMRVEAARGWTAAPYDLTLAVIVRAGVLPELDEDDQVDVPESLRAWLRTPDGGLRRMSGDIANRLFAAELDSSGQTTSPSPVERYHLWLALAEAWAQRCAPRGAARNDATIVGAVRGGFVAGELVSEDEYSLARYRRSEQLDVDHLSPPTPE